MLGLYAVRKHSLLIFQFFSSATIFLILKIIKAVVGFNKNWQITDKSLKATC